MKKIAIIIIAIGVVILSYFVSKLEKEKDPAFENTEMRIVNDSPDSVLMFLTLGPQDSSWTSNVEGIFGVIAENNNPLQGSVWIQAGDSVSYTPTKCFSGNISFGTPPQNCPDTIWETGVNIFEFNLNEPQESIDISCIAGVNSILKCNLIGGPAWPADTALNPRVLLNDTIYNNTGRVGVYPFGCTNCVNGEGRQTCQNPIDKPNQYKICNPTRALNDKGGIVRVSFLRWSTWEILK